jgi:DNA-binding NarL/FixJ family response regulator
MFGRLIAGIPQDLAFSLASMRERADAEENGGPAIGIADPTKGAGHPTKLRPGNSLTAREHAIVAGVLAGRSNAELSSDLKIARKTVEAYLNGLYGRFGVLTRTELAIVATRENWLDRPIRQVRHSDLA